MATLEQLVVASKIVAVDPNDLLEIDQQPFRRLFLSEKMLNWITNALPNLRTDGYVEGALSPKEQAFIAFQDFVSGERPANFEMLPNRLRPRQFGIWEFRTADLRIFGVFVKKDVFIACSACTKRQAIKQNNAGYAFHRDQTLAFLSELSLNEPKILYGDLEDVITI